MDFKQLRAFLTVADTGNVTRAAEQLHLVQPAVSRQIQLLEDDLDTLLFERERHGMVLTESGKALQSYAQRIMLELDRARAEVSHSGADITGLVTLGLLPSTVDTLAVPLASLLSATYPGIRIRLSMGYAGTLAHWLESGEVDAALMYGAERSKNTWMKPLLEEPLWVIGPQTARLRKSRPVSLSALAEKPVILPGPSHGIRALVDHACAVGNVALTIAAETNALSVQRRLVLGGIGWTILPPIAVAEDLRCGALSGAPLTEPAIQRVIAIGLPANRPIGKHVRCVVDLLEACVCKAVRNGQWPEAHLKP